MLRVVEIEQLSAIDASQTNLPEEWKNLPAYKSIRAQAMGFKVHTAAIRNPTQSTVNQQTIMAGL